MNSLRYSKLFLVMTEIGKSKSMDYHRSVLTLLLFSLYLRDMPTTHLKNLDKPMIG